MERNQYKAPALPRWPEERRYGMTRPFSTQIEAVEKRLAELPTAWEREHLLATLELNHGLGMCSRCGLVAAEKSQSGIATCWACWNIAKLDYPAAVYWAEAAAHALRQLDMYDLTQYLPSCGLSRAEVVVFTEALTLVRERSRRLKEHPYEPAPVSLRKPGSLIAKGLRYEQAQREARQS